MSVKDIIREGVLCNLLFIGIESEIQGVQRGRNRCDKFSWNDVV